MTTSNAWTRSGEEVASISYRLLKQNDLGLEPSERLVLMFYVLAENKAPLSRSEICTMARISAQTFYLISERLAERGLIEREKRSGRAPEVKTTLPADVVRAIIDSLKTQKPDFPDPVRSIQGEADPVPCVQGGDVAPCTLHTGSEGEGVCSVQGGGAAETPQGVRSVQGAEGEGVRSVQGDQQPEAAHMTTRARTRPSRADHHRLSSVEEGKKVTDRAVSVSDSQPSLFSAHEAGPDHCLVNGKAISWIDPTNGTPQQLTFRLLENSVSTDPTADPAHLREWARREIDLAIAEGKDGNLSRWLRHVFQKTWPRFKAQLSEPEKLTKFAPSRRMSDKLEPWEG